MKTPGVYILEKDAFPNSVVEVATAVPAFIGYTDYAKNGGKSLSNKPFRITSFAEYVKYFGGGPEALFEMTPAYQVALDKEEAKDPKVDAAITALTNALATDVAAAALTKATIANKEAVAAATANPDDAAATAAVTATQTALEAAQGDFKTAKEASDTTDNDIPWMPESDFSSNGVEYVLNQTKGNYNLYNNMRLFYQNGGGPCYIISVGNYSQDIEKAKLAAGVELLVKESEPTMIVIPDAVLIPDIDDCYSLYQAVLMHCGGKMQSRVGILDIYDGYKDRQDPDGDVVEFFRDKVASDYLAFGSAYYPWVNTTIVQGSELSFLNISNLDLLQDVLRIELGVADAAADYTTPKTAAVIAEINKIPGAAADALASVDPDSAEVAAASTLNKTLTVLSPEFNQILSEIRKNINLMAPSAAMAGIYTKVDNSRGVWKAPANTAVASVVSPAVNITHDDQEDLNMPLQGKAVNAIRSFVGEGTLVWGARTLDGNSQDWRYISVRRTMIMLEQSIKIAAKAYVFEPNDANTWVSIQSMLNNFLTGQWKQGALVGAVPTDAFSVQVGLGSTMTSNDILDGIMRITVLVAISRPAEFIEITFQQQMQKS